MALRDQPYLPLYIKDFATDEKLAECSAQAHGVYIRLMCLMHKSDEYGTISLKEKHQKATDKIKAFAEQIAKHMPFEAQIIESSLRELVAERVLKIEGAKIIQKRMVKDNELSVKRSIAANNKYKDRAPEFCISKTPCKTEANSHAKEGANSALVLANANEGLIINKDSQNFNNDITYSHSQVIEALTLDDYFIEQCCDHLKITRPEFTDYTAHKLSEWAINHKSTQYPLKTVKTILLSDYPKYAREKQSRKQTASDKREQLKQLRDDSIRDLLNS